MTEKEILELLAEKGIKPLTAVLARESEFGMWTPVVFRGLDVDGLHSCFDGYGDDPYGYSLYEIAPIPGNEDCVYRICDANDIIFQEDLIAWLKK